jgi:hypothetical protein
VQNVQKQNCLFDTFGRNFKSSHELRATAQ